ncbi:ABC transporter substrate-binding protein [Lyngbya sp. PCC 8106]|uniref:ABC transporter substrate-binding protein n=1 Tax=Lyngbya sp. (strain PCC 8106) TaxID=313612 RepID=UPI0000EAB72A|nr:extracellular solute-binding protein [Lyngbya sp. PCC 8106]EAW36616.1 putative ABC transporter solute-binding protein [Lyngbya sp. PCC 8106]
MMLISDCLLSVRQFLIARLLTRWLPVGLSLAIAACHGISANESRSDSSSDLTKTTPHPNFEGVTLTVLSLTPGNGITEPIIDHAAQFEALTGVEIKMITAPFDLLYQEILNDFRRGIHNYDVVIIPPQWKADYVQYGYLQDLTKRVKTDSAIQWEDIAVFFREYYATYEGKVYAIPLDGEVLSLYYRSDILEQQGVIPPQTWDQYLDLAQKMDGQDLNNDGEADYGSCIARTLQTNSRMLWAVASSFLQTQGTQQGAFFDSDTMKPLVNNPAFIEALAIYKETATYGPTKPGNETLSAMEIRSLFLSGRCALTIDWGNLGTLAMKSNSPIKNQFGTAILPGSPKVLDRETGQLVTCNQSICPYSEEGINYAPYAAFGGWVGTVNGALEGKTLDTAYAFLSYMSQPEQSNLDVMTSSTGFNPYRMSQLTNRQSWIEAGMNKQLASRYLNAIYMSLNNPNIVLDLSIPQYEVYQQEILHPILMDVLNNEISLSEAILKIDSSWEEKTDELGRESQRQAYCQSLKIECN